MDDVDDVNRLMRNGVIGNVEVEADGVGSEKVSPLICLRHQVKQG